MADVLPWPGDLLTLNDVCARLRSGQIVGIATEVGFEALASGLDPSAIGRLAAVAAPDVPVALALASPREVFDWAPHLRGAGLRLARDFWPGSLVLVTSLGLPFGLLPRLPIEVRKHLERPEGVALLLSPRDDLSNLFSAFGGPLMIAPDATSKVDVVLDVAPPGPTSEITVVAAGERDVRILRAGALRRDDLEASAGAKIVFVCTGNTCRSPMAE